MTVHVISVEIDASRLTGYSDSFLATAWHVAQVNPAPFGDHDAVHLVERVGREIIRRWLQGVPPELWHHQGRHYEKKWLTTFAKYEPGGPQGSPEWHHGTWVLKDPPNADAGEVG
jgi:hypothetical protein